MRKQSFLVAIAMIAGAAMCRAQSERLPVAGYVTRVNSANEFDLNGVPVSMTAKTAVLRGLPGTHDSWTILKREDLQPYVGEPLNVYPAAGSKQSALTAEKIAVPAPHDGEEIRGSAVIESVLPASPAGSASEWQVHADGYVIAVTPKTKVQTEKSLQWPGDLRANLWVAYRGKTLPDGRIEAQQVSLCELKETDAAAKLRTYWEYDPEALPTDLHQDGWSKAFRGRDPSQYPIHQDAAMLQRVRTVGSQVVPKFATELPATSPFHLNFRFYLVDADWREPAALPSGIILVPYQVVNKLKSDGQLAAVLADKVAGLLERQPQVLPLTYQQVAEGAALTGAEYIPIAGVGFTAYNVVSAISSVKTARQNEEQRERMTLSLLHGAGFDVDEAPTAWWLLASKEPKDLKQIKIPSRSIALYRLIGEHWSAQGAVPANRAAL